MSQTICGQCQQDITGIDHRGACPGIAISWTRVSHQGVNGGKYPTYSKFHAFKIQGEQATLLGSNFPAVALCGFVAECKHENDFYQSAQSPQLVGTCTSCQCSIIALAVKNKSQSIKREADVHKLVNYLHAHGLSDLAWHLDVYLRFATPGQCSALHNCISNYAKESV